jgi:hypothetical protein
LTVFGRNFSERRNVALGNDKEMHRRGRINVVEGKNFLILIDLLAGDFPAGDLAKQAVIILHKTSSKVGF